MLVDLIKDSPDAKLSSSRVWFNVANLAATGIYLYASFNAANSTSIDLDGLAWYTLVYMGVVTGNKFANKFLATRYGSSNDTSKYDSKREELTSQ